MKALSTLFVACVATLPAHAQMWDRLCIEPMGTDTAETRVLGLKVDATAFFRDNEYDGSTLTDGYTLPGVRLRPALTYNPIPAIHLELGAYAIFYDGAGKYPNYAYHDIATWKGQQYSRGIHALPFFRAGAKVRNLYLVLGNIYGAQNHRLIDPMYNAELNLTADPEMGFQLMLDRRHIHLDSWIDWQSYIYKLDTHQEAFTVGTNAIILWGRSDRRLHWSSPVQMLIQHRGGEQDTTHLGVQTFANLSAGVRMDYAPRLRHVNAMTAEANLLASYQQSGTYWPFDTGFATHVAVGLTLWDGLGLRAGYFAAPKQFANLYGNPYMSTLNAKDGTTCYRGMHTAYVRADYTYTFTPSYQLGAELEAISANASGVSDLGFSFGVYIRVCPHLSIKRF